MIDGQSTAVCSVWNRFVVPIVYFMHRKWDDRDPDIVRAAVRGNSRNSHNPLVTIIYEITYFHPR